MTTTSQAPSTSSVKFNKVIVIGDLREIEFRPAGSAMVWITSSDRDEVRINGAPVPSVFTPVVIVRLPKNVAERLRDAGVKAGDILSIEARAQGIKRMVDGKPYYFTEIVASSAKIMGSVAHEDHDDHEVVEVAAHIEG